MTKLGRITVVGAGLMGHGIAQVFASQGHPVSLVDTSEETLESAQVQIRANLTQMSEHGITFPLEFDEILANINTTIDLRQGAAASDFVFEAVFEDMELKQQIFADLDKLCPPHTILCSNTSVMSITEIASHAGNPSRILGTHFWNPPYLMPLVEVIKGQKTDPKHIETTFNLLGRVGKHPVRVHKDVPGFVANRLQHALWREAFAIVDEGICDPATIDECVRYGPGLRWPVLGPIENADLIGLDLTIAIHNYILPHINAAPTPSTTLAEHVSNGNLGFKTNRGFLDWPEGKIAATRRRLNEHLLSMQKKVQSEES